jgi:hypothetical protein
MGKCKLGEMVGVEGQEVDKGRSWDSAALCSFS